jgi:YVTN family beta-propeller protein
MQTRSWNHTLLAMLCSIVAAIWWRSATPFAKSQGEDARFAGPTSSQPLALSANGSLLAVVNPDNDTLTFFGVAGGQSNRLAEVEVGQEPIGVAVLPDGSKAYVANTVGGTVSVINIDPGKGKFNQTRKIKVGTEPYGLALTPNGSKLYVTNARSNSVSVIDTDSDKVVTTIEDVGFEPRGLAITNDGDGSDTDETVYVTQFLSLPVAGKVDGEDDA